MPVGYDFITAAAIPLTGLTAWQGITEELEATPGRTALIPGGSGSWRKTILSLRWIPGFLLLIRPMKPSGL